jgi:hypothetical protein
MTDNHTDGNQVTFDWEDFGSPVSVSNMTELNYLKPDDAPSGDTFKINELSDSLSPNEKSEYWQNKKKSKCLASPTSPASKYSVVDRVDAMINDYISVPKKLEQKPIERNTEHFNRKSSNDSDNNIVFKFEDADNHKIRISRYEMKMQRTLLDNYNKYNYREKDADKKQDDIQKFWEEIKKRKETVNSGGNQDAYTLSVNNSEDVEYVIDDSDAEYEIENDSDFSDDSDDILEGMNPDDIDDIDTDDVDTDDVDTDDLSDLSDDSDEEKVEKNNSSNV